ncbi:hypothetical protein ACPYO6_12000 [Georgenia sp. Z1344]|uniref:hypothetical protein n=1 Tax=Georgenia sp. Z1344 TaxID=3416706 RepID=UPI003CEDD03F
MTRAPDVRDHPTPILTPEEVRHLLVEANADLGARGGAVGGAIGGGIGGAAAGALGGSVGGRSGGRSGGRLGARLFTKVYGSQRVVPIPPTPEREAALAAVLHTVLRQDRQALIGLMGSGSMNMNTAVVQVQWHPNQAVITAHGLEGIIKQRTSGKAIDRLEAAMRETAA